ncbi:MAG: glycosyltransferase family A protein [Rhodospirillaceae bacterium]|nr:glycosyltransferase family A protein [Rhodospirillaceae bacterium]
MPSRLPPSAAIVIPAYNAAATIDRTLASAAAAVSAASAAMVLEAEIVVVDDHSTDDTAARVRAWAAREPAVRLVVLAENKGPGFARNEGVRRSAGQFLFFLDADDVFYADHVRLCLHALLADDSLGYVFTRTRIDLPMHADWRASMDESNPINFCVRRIWHDLIGGFAEEPDFRTWRTEDTLYRKCLRDLVKHAKIDVETCEQFVSPGNALDRQRAKLAMSMAEWRANGGDDGFFMTEAMKQVALERLMRVHKLRGG